MAVHTVVAADGGEPDEATPLSDVVEMLERHTPFEHIEAYIENRRDLDQQGRNVLWLYAWANADDTEAQRAVIETLASGA